MAAADDHDDEFDDEPDDDLDEPDDEFDDEPDDDLDDEFDDEPDDGGSADDPVGAGGEAGDAAPTDRLGAFIRSQRELARMSVRRLAEAAGVSNPYLSQIERGIRRPSAEILQQLANALRISVETLYVQAGFLQPHTERHTTVPDAIEHDPVLTPEQKTALLGVYRSFVDQGPPRRAS